MTWLNGRGILMRDARWKELRNRRTMMSVRWRPGNTTWCWCEVLSGYGHYLKSNGSTEWICGGNKKFCSMSWGFGDSLHSWCSLWGPWHTARGGRILHVLSQSEKSLADPGCFACCPAGTGAPQQESSWWPWSLGLVVKWWHPPRLQCRW